MTTKNTKNTKNTKEENKKLIAHLNTIRTACKNAREASQDYTAKIIYAFLLDAQDYKKTEAKIRDIVADSYGDEWQAVKGSENRKIRYARIVFENRIEALKDCKNTADVLHYLKTNQKELSHSKILNINTNQRAQASKPAIKPASPQAVNPNLYGTPNPVKNPNPESESMQVVAFLKSAVKNPKLLAMINERLSESGIKIQYIPNLNQKVA